MEKVRARYQLVAISLHVRLLIGIIGVRRVGVPTPPLKLIGELSGVVKFAPKLSVFQLLLKLYCPIKPTEPYSPYL